MSEARDAEEPLDLSDERHVRRRSRDVQARENTRAQVLRNLMASIDGREWMYDLLTECHAYDSSFSSDAPLMAFREGHRSIGIWLIKQIEISCPEAYLQMVKEAKEWADVRG